MKTSKRSKAFTAFLTILIVIAFIIPFFLLIKSVSASSLGKTIIKHFVYMDGTPIGAGLEVMLNDGVGFSMTELTDDTGTVYFRGLADETYKIKWSWQGIACEELVNIDCSQIDWEYTNEVPSWTIEKTFTYEDGTPIVGLEVRFDGQVGTTNDLGIVSFSCAKACCNYDLTWLWQALPDCEPVHVDGFQTPSPYVVPPNMLPSWTIEKTFTYEDGTPIVGLEVGFDGQVGTTDASGTVSFSCAKACCDYDLMWLWQALPDCEPVHVPEFQTPSPYMVPTNVLPYWTVCKTFYYDTTPALPVVGLEVTFDGQVGFTDMNGKVCFMNVKAGTYMIEWVWGGVPAVHGPFTIAFGDVTPYVVPDNYLVPKSGGGI